MTKNSTEMISLSGKKTLINILSLALIAVCVLVSLLKGVNLGTDFGGGAALTVQFTAAPLQAQVDKAVKAVKDNSSAQLISVQKYSTDSLLIRTSPMEDCAKVRTAVAAALSLKEDAVKAENTPRNVTKDVLLSIGVSLLIAGGIALVYFAFRFGILATLGTLYGFVVMSALWLLCYSTFAVLDYKAFTVLAIALALYVIETAFVLGKRIKKAENINLAPSRNTVLTVTAVGVVTSLILALVGSAWTVAAPLSILILGACFTSLFATGAFILMFKK